MKVNFLAIESKTYSSYLIIILLNLINAINSIILNNNDVNISTLIESYCSMYVLFPLVSTIFLSVCCKNKVFNLKVISLYRFQSASKIILQQYIYLIKNVLIFIVMFFIGFFPLLFFFNVKLSFSPIVVFINYFLYLLVVSCIFIFFNYIIQNLVVSFLISIIPLYVDLLYFSRCATSISAFCVPNLNYPLNVNCFILSFILFVSSLLIFAIHYFFFNRIGVVKQ